MKVLAVSNAFPTPSLEAQGIYAWREVLGLRSLGVEVEDYRSTFRRDFRGSWVEVRRRIEASRPDLVNVYAGSIGAFAVSLACPVPLVMTFGGPDLLGPAAQDSFSERGVGVMAVAFSQAAIPSADAIVVRSAQLRRRLLRARDRERAHVIAAGVDVEVFRPLDKAAARREVGWDPAARVILFGASRRRAIKRFDRAADAVARLAARGVAARIESCEQVPPARMPLLLSAADCLLLTSQHEGSPNIVKEAAACGCPVVSVPVGDVAEVLEGVRPGRIVEPDGELLATALEEVLAAGRRSNGPGRIKARYALPITAGRVRQVYEETLDAWRAGRRHGWRRLHR